MHWAKFSYTAFGVPGTGGRGRYGWLADRLDRLTGWAVYHRGHLKTDVGDQPSHLALTADRGSASTAARVKKVVRSLSGFWFLEGNGPTATWSVRSTLTGNSPFLFEIWPCLPAVIIVYENELDSMLFPDGHVIEKVMGMTLGQGEQSGGRHARHTVHPLNDLTTLLAGGLAGDFMPIRLSPVKHPY
ncbi:hypothetical protein E4U21_001480 [Claviceps maximensis]|nr:hypothetical protein E4U21_001480 [Claviceps maximensis]